MFREPWFIGTQKSHDVNIKNKVQEKKVKIKDKTNVVVGASLSTKNREYIIPTMDCYLELDS